MLFSQLKLFAAHLPMNYIANTLLVPHSGYIVERTQLRSITRVSIFGVPLLKNESASFVSSFWRSDFCTVLHATVGTRDISYYVESHLREVGAHVLEEISSIEDAKVDDCPSVAGSSGSKDNKEMERRRKIGLANKGKVPWNKGKKHSAETRERIRQKTREALSNPKIRKKMSECPRSLSNHTRAKMSKSLKRLWGKRLKWKRTRQKFLQLWAESIANAAKEGGIDEQELEWDSYEKMKSKIALIEQEQAEQKAKEKELARIRSEITAKERLAQKKKKLEQNTKLGGESKRKVRKKSKEEKEELAVTEELKLKARLVKIHKKRSLTSKVSSKRQRAWDNMELKNRDDLPPQISLADQIRLAKIKRTEYTT